MLGTYGGALWDKTNKQLTSIKLSFPMFGVSQCVSWVIYPFYSQTIRFAVWASGKQNSVLNFFPQSRLPFAYKSVSFTEKRAAKTINWYQRWLSRKETRPEKQKNLFRHSVAPANFPLKRPERSPGVPFTGSFRLYFCKQ